ncbi:hypothetical protein QUB11_03745 [Microcoleus sp. B6-A1]|uniref:hypothetical protein n=1 Tax=Microcoleus sp. B6-A1 TaxID=2818684 RepID=UPI002FCEC5CF
MISIDNDRLKALMIDKDTYILRVQGYKYLAAENSSETVLRNYIEVLKFPGDIDVITFTGEGTQLVGYLCRTHDLSNPNPDLWDVPKFIPFDDQFYDEKRATYFGDTGFEFAKKELDKLSKPRLAKGIKRYLIKNYLRTITAFLQMYNPCGEGLITVEEVEFFAFKAPDILEADGGGNYFKLNLTADEDDKTTAYYMLSGKYQR